MSFQIFHDFEVDFCQRLLTFLQTKWKKPWQSYSANFYDKRSSVGWPIPNLKLHFHKKDTPNVYVAHPGRLVFTSRCENAYPIIREMRQKVEEVLQTSFSFCTIILYLKDHHRLNYH